MPGCYRWQSQAPAPCRVSGCRESSHCEVGTTVIGLLAALSSTHRAVIVGSSFIGLECAASLRERDIAVTVVTPEDVPSPACSATRSVRPSWRHTRRKVRSSSLATSWRSFWATSTSRRHDQTGRAQIPADLAFIGIGIAPVTDFINGIELTADGGVVVDEFLQAAEGLFAAGDIAAFTLPLTGERNRIEHWRLACEQGSLAARNMLGQRIAYAGVPFFWSAQKLALYYVGHADAGADCGSTASPAGTVHRLLLPGRPGRCGSGSGAECGNGRTSGVGSLEPATPKQTKVARSFDAVARLRQIMPV